METDDVMPNDGSYFGVPVEPKDQRVSRLKEKAQTLQAVDALKDMVKRLELRIEFFEKHTSIDDDVRLDPEKFLIVSNSYKLTADTLRAEKEWIQDLLDTHAPNL